MNMIPSNYLLIVAIVFFAVLLIGGLVILKALKLLVKITMPDIEKEEKAALALKKIEKKDTKSIWNKILGLHDLEEEDELAIDHEYDGIRELDNPIPLWFNALFYSSIAFAVVYFMIYQVFGWGMNQTEDRPA